MRKENEDSTPVETPKDTRRNHVNQSTEKKDSGGYGVIAIIVILAIIALGLLFFYGLWV